MEILISNQGPESQIVKNGFPIGPVAREDQWPIEKLISSYSGVVPTFPGIYTLLHNEYEYAPDYPWSDQPVDSFDPDFLNSLVGTALGDKDSLEGAQPTLRDSLLSLDGSSASGEGADKKEEDDDEEEEEGE